MAVICDGRNAWTAPSPRSEQLLAPNGRSKSQLDQCLSTPHVCLCPLSRMGLCVTISIEIRSHFICFLAIVLLIVSSNPFDLVLLFTCKIYILDFETREGGADNYSGVAKTGAFPKACLQNELHHPLCLASETENSIM